MNDVSLVHMLDAFANLAHVIDDFGLGHCIAFGCDLFK
jgi:hypothetical protein